MPAEAKCPYCEDAAAYLADELAANERAAFEEHVAGCEECSLSLDSTRSLVALLHSAPRAEVNADLAPAVLARIHASKPTWPRVAAFAAAAAVVLALALPKTWWPAERTAAPSLASAEPVHSEAASVERALTWLCKAQEPDGSWSAARWGGDQRFEVALTALPLMALLGGKDATPEHSAAVAKAVKSLQQRQAANGSFGGAFFGSCYNQGTATLALLRAYRLQPDAELKRTIEAACAVIVSTQTTSGGWGYLGSTQPHPTVTLWNLEALKMASALGFEDTRPSIDRGREWMLTHAPATAPAGTVDFYNAHFLASVLQRSDDAPPREKLASIRETLLTSQVREGLESGSWSPDDQWGRVGGRLYSTALASLALR